MTQEVVIDLGAAVPVYEQFRSLLAGTIVSRVADLVRWAMLHARPWPAEAGRADGQSE